MAPVMEQDIRVGREEFGVTLTPQDVLDSWGSPPEITYPKLFGRNGSTMPWQEMRATFQRYDSQFPRRLLPGVLSVITKLERAGIIRGIVTSGMHDKVIEYMRQSGLDPDRLDFIHTDREVNEDQAAGRPILARALGERAMHGIAGHQVVFVGDEAVTVEQAEAVGVRPVVVASGTASKNQLLRQGVPASIVVESMLELPAYLGLNT